MKFKTAAVAVLAAYISGWVVLAATEIGTTTSSGVRIGWEFPLNFLMLLIVPALLGYFIGQNSRE